MKVLLTGPPVIAVALVLSLGQGERPATATEVRKAAPSLSRPAPITPKVERQQLEEASQVQKDPASPEAPARSALTPMDRGQAASHLAEAWQRALGEAPSDLTLAVLCAHWAHETDHGRRMHAYNFGGIKGMSPSGGSVVIWTREQTGEERLVRRTFRAYPSPEEGARDYVNLLAERYSAAFRAAREANVERFVAGLGARGYFTDDEGTYLRSLTRLARECARDLGRQSPRPGD